MNRISLSSNRNSRAAYEPFINAYGAEYIAPFSMFSQYSMEMQSPSVTRNGFLWQRMLARMAYDNPATISKKDLDKNELSQSGEQIQKNRALIQLLRSWREGDAQEQSSTWEYLKRAIDEDRLSERKLFP